MAKATHNEEEIKLNKFIDDHLFKQAKTWKFYYSGNNQAGWINDIRWYKGIQWPVNRPKDKSSVFFNRLFSTIQKELPFMTDRKPKIYILPQEPSDKPFADILSKIIDTNWTERSMEMKIPEGVMHAKQLGTGFFRPFWNPELLNGLGDFDCDVPDPLEMFPLAYSKRLEDSKGVIWARWVSLAYIRFMYPKEGARVKASTESKEMGIPDRCKATSANGDGISQTSNLQNTDDSSSPDSSTVSTYYLPSEGNGGMDSEGLKRVLLKTTLIRDDSVKEIKEGDKSDKKSVALYPTGRMIVTANGITLEDGPFPFDTFPGFVECINYVEPGEFWAMSDMKQIKEGQKALNKLNASIIDSVNRDVYRQRFIASDSGIDVDNYVVTMDACYETKIANPVQESGQWSLPAQVLQYPQIIEQAIATTAGAQEFSPPKSGDAEVSGRALAEWQQITQTRLRQKLRNLEYSIKKIAQAWVEMILKNYTETRIMRIMNSGTGQNEYVYIFKQETDTPEGQAMAAQIKQKAQQAIVPGSDAPDPQTGQPGQGIPLYQHVLNMADIKSGLDVTVGTGSTVSVNQVTTYNQSANMFQLGVIDQQALLDSAEYPNKEEIMQRMNAAKEQGMQMQMQMKQLEIQLEQAKLKTDVQTTDMDNKTNIQTTDMEVKGKMAVEGMRVIGRHDDYVRGKGANE